MRRSPCATSTRLLRSDGTKLRSTKSGPAWKAEAELQLFDSPWDDVASLLPVREVISGYYVQVGTSWNGGTTLTHR